MEINKLDEFVNGWFIGDFDPTLLKTDLFEISIKRYKANDYEKSHYHKIATEYTIIIDGEVEMNGLRYSKNNIIKISPNESTDFKCITDVVTVVVKTPSISNDKFIN